MRLKIQGSISLPIARKHKYITDTTVQVIPKNPVQDDTTTEVVWDVIVKWSGSNLPCPYDVPAGIFDECVANS